MMPTLGHGHEGTMTATRLGCTTLDMEHQKVRKFAVTIMTSQPMHIRRVKLAPPSLMRKTVASHAQKHFMIG